MTPARHARRLAAACGLGWLAVGAASAQETLPPPKPVPAAPPASKPAPYARRELLPIDLPTALRLVNARNPSIGVAQARVREAYARWDQARVLWLPDLSAGTEYLRHDGQIQRSVGDVFTTSRSSIFVGGSAALNLNTPEALFLPLVARRLVDATAADARAVTNDANLDAALAYVDLLDAFGRLAINADTLARAEQVLKSAQAGEEAGINRTAADVNRIATEVYFRRQEALDLRGRASAASARLAQVLLLDPAVLLRPADATPLPLVIVPDTLSLEDLVRLGLTNRPEVASAQAQLAAAGVRTTQATVGPLVPRFRVDYTAGGFGGGVNDDIINFNGRGDGRAAAFWELRNLGLGNLAQIRERRAAEEGQAYRVNEVQARVGAEVVAAAEVAGARFAALDAGQEGVRQALEMYRKLRETSFGVVGPRPQFDALEPLLAVQALNQARVQYLSEVVEFNRAQFRLYNAIGQPAVESLNCTSVAPLEVPAAPPPPDLKSAVTPEKAPGR